MTGETLSEAVAEFEFETETTPDVWVADEWVNQYGDKRAALEGRTYAVFKEGGLKAALDWNRTHHDWDAHRKQWVVDSDSLDYLREKAAEMGFDVAGGGGMDEELTALVEVAEAGQQIHVEYRMKGKDSHSTFGGEIERVSDKTVVFYREDGQSMSVQSDEHGDIGLFTFGSHAPYVGEPVNIRIE